MILMTNNVEKKILILSRFSTLKQCIDFENIFAIKTLYDIQISLFILKTSCVPVDLNYYCVINDTLLHRV